MLSSDLSSEIRPDFLRLLGSPAARVYIDAMDSVEREAALRTGPLPREVGLALIERVVERHAEIEIEEASDQSIRERARVVLERLCAAEWLRSEERSDYRRFLFVEPAAVFLLDALRKIARPGAAVFSDALIGACNSLKNTDALRAEPWPIIQNCLEHVHTGEQEIRAVAKSVERHTRKQLAAQTLRENLEVVFDRYSADIGHGAYAELVRSRLPTRLPEARDAVEALQGDADLLHKMADEVARRSGCEYSTAMARVRTGLHDLAQALDRIVPSTDEVDRRTAEFTRKSLARFRYLQEVTGEQRAAVQAFFEKLNAHFAGRRVSDAEAEISELPQLLLAEVKIPAGLESLYAPRLRRDLGEIEALDEDVGEDVLDRTQRELASTLRDSLTVTRANRFAADAFAKHGSQVQSSLLLRSDDDLADLIACLLHASAREAKYRVEIARDLDEPAGDLRQEDLVLAGTRRLERFILAKK
jgi:hypothetical protein